jgi:hypothetical protein
MKAGRQASRQKDVTQLGIQVMWQLVSVAGRQVLRQ